MIIDDCLRQPHFSKSKRSVSHALRCALSRVPVADRAKKSVQFYVLKGLSLTNRSFRSMIYCRGLIAPVKDLKYTRHDDNISRKSRPFPNCHFTFLRVPRDVSFNVMVHDPIHIIAFRVFIWNFAPAVSYLLTYLSPRKCSAVNIICELRFMKKLLIQHQQQFSSFLQEITRMNKPIFPSIRNL